MADSGKKQVPLRLSPKLYDAIAAWAEDDFRSVNGQIEYLLTECVRQRKKNGKYVSDEIDISKYSAERKKTADEVQKMKHWKKMVAPIVVALVVVLYYVGIAVLFMTVSGIPAVVQVLMVIIPLILAAVMIGVLISRIKEIQGGEEDDLSQY